LKLFAFFLAGGAGYWALHGMGAGNGGAIAALWVCGLLAAFGAHHLSRHLEYQRRAEELHRERLRELHGEREAGGVVMSTHGKPMGHHLANRKEAS
jgi:hypothetical protein